MNQQTNTANVTSYNSISSVQQEYCLATTMEMLHQTSSAGPSDFLNPPRPPQAQPNFKRTAYFYALCSQNEHSFFHYMKSPKTFVKTMKIIIFWNRQTRAESSHIPYSN